MRTEEVGFVVGTFVLVGLGVGAAAALTTGWAETAFAVEAGGDAERFGPVFVAQLYLSVTAAALVVAPALAGVLGVLVGSRSYAAGDAAATCGVGSGVGALAYALVVVALVVASQGAAAEQAYAFADALVPAFGTAVAAAAVGGIAGVAGSMAG